MKFYHIIGFFLLINYNLNGQYLADHDETYKKIEDYQLKYDENSNYILQQLGQKYFTKKNAFELSQKSIKETFPSDTEALGANKYLFEKFISGEYPTRFQDPLDYLLYAILMEKIDSVSKTICPNVSYKPKFGTFYSNSINAERKSYKDDYLILIHSNYIKFSFQMGKVCLQFLKNYSDDSLGTYLDTIYIKKLIEKDKEIPLNLSYTFLEFNYKHFPKNDSLLISNVAWLRDQFIQKALQYWNNTNEIFVLGHEYSHALLKHSTGDADFVNDTILLKSWLNEAQADSMSQEILNAIVLNNKSDPYQMGWNKYLLMGGVFYLNILKVFENGQSILNNDKEIPQLSKAEHDTIISIFKNKHDLNSNLKRFSTLSRSITQLDHPPTSIRIELLQEILKNLMSKSFYSEDEINNKDNVTLRLAVSMMFSLKNMDMKIKDGFHNAYLMKDYLNKNYK